MRLVGDAALLLEVDDVAAWTTELTRRRALGEFDADEIVPGARTVLVDGLANPAGLAAAIRTWPTPQPIASSGGQSIEIPTVYDGPDLAMVAQCWRLSVDEAIAEHGRIEFRVEFFGFAPGFAYLSGVPDRLRVARHATPRTQVAAGSVALADNYGAIYPSASPGGWRVIGRTPSVLFDVNRNPPAMLAAGDRVRFIRVDG